MAKNFKCAVTGEAVTKEEMLRFVLSPDNRLIFDPECKLDATSIIIKDDNSIVRDWLSEDFFKENINIHIETSLIISLLTTYYYNKILTFIALAKKSGKLQHGKSQVEDALKHRESERLILIQASDASEREKIKRKDILSLEIFDSEKISNLLGDQMIKYAIISAEFADLITKFYNKYTFFKSLNDRQ